MSVKSHNGGGWNPYLAGALAGVLIILSVLVTGKYFGASTSIVRTASFIEGLIAPEHVANTPYLTRYTPRIDWQWMFVAGILIGSFVSSITSRSFRWQAVPNMWESRFGTNPLIRGAVAFIGGAIVMFGARMAGG